MSPAFRSLVPAFARFTTAVAVASALGAASFAITCTFAERLGLTSLRFGHDLEMLTGDGASRAAQGADVVIRVSPRGIFASLVIAAVLVLTYAGIVEVLGHRSWRVGAAALSIATFLVAGLVFGPYVNAHVPRSEGVAGVFGVDAGLLTPLVLAAASAVFGIVVARVHGLIRSPEGWPTADVPASAIVPGGPFVYPEGDSTAAAGRDPGLIATDPPE
ncbi:MAG TPA: hypothetical protein PKD59_10870 [Miltoncostaeaceae bacterium]|nr:hypothetical protein [Miltoncostaeaceae bacterium]